MVQVRLLEWGIEPGTVQLGVPIPSPLLYTILPVPQHQYSLSLFQSPSEPVRRQKPEQVMQFMFVGLSELQSRLLSGVLILLQHFRCFESQRLFQ